MNELKNKDGKRNGLITTLLVHACLLILCFFLGFTYYIPAKGTIGMDISGVGFPDAGKNNDPATAEKVSDQTQEQQTPKTTSSAAQENDFANQQNSEVAINKGDQKAKKQPVKQEKPKKPVEPVEEPKKIDPRLTDFGGKIKGPNNPDGGRDNDNLGSSGVIDGKNGTGEGDQTGGVGVGGGVYDFGTRRALQGPGTLKHECGKNIKGIVRVRIGVNHMGKIVDRAFVSKGSTVSNSCVINKVLDAIKDMQYSNTAAAGIERHVIDIPVTISK